MLKQTLNSSVIIIFIFVFIFSSVNAQSFENTINLYGNNFPQEKIHIHFDKEAYLPGETIWFKAYLFEENLPSEKSTNFYSAIYDDLGQLVQKIMAPIINSSAYGSFVLPDTIKSSQVICRAYTTWMLNFDTNFIYSKSIKLLDNTLSEQSIAKEQTVSLQFFPEGGDIIEDVSNTIAFKANFNNGLPFAINAVIKEQETGIMLMPIKSMHDGMGRFDLEALEGKNFYAEWQDHKGEIRRSNLPKTKKIGVSLKLNIQKNQLYFNVINKTGMDSLHVIMYMYQKVFYKADIKVQADEPFTAAVPIKGLPSGTMQLTVFDGQWQPVAERLAFINNDNFTISGLLVNKEINNNARAKNLLEFFVTDTIVGNFSLSVTDADLNHSAMGDNILSNFLLNGDLRGYIHQPNYYFSNQKDIGIKTHLDLVMLTNGWRRYNWDDLKVEKMPLIQFPKDEYLSVYGQVSPSEMQNLNKEEMVNLIIIGKDSSKNYFTIKPDLSGLVKQTGLIFYDTAKIYYSFNKNKKLNDQMAFSKYNYTLSQPLTIGNYQKYQLPDTTGTGSILSNSLFKYYVANQGIKKFNDEKTLEAVSVKSGGWRNWRNDPLVKMDERYATGVFTGGSISYSFDILNDAKAINNLNIFNYLRNVIPGLAIGSMNVAAGRTLTYLGKPVFIYINESEREVIDLDYLSMYQIAYLKFLPNFMGRGPEGGIDAINPALSIYLRKGSDLIDRVASETDLGMVKVGGYSPIKEFYSPDYTISNTNTGVDARATLLWMPNIITNSSNIKIKIPFFNNDFTKKFRVVLEGINEEGKMIHIDRVIE